MTASRSQREPQPATSGAQQRPESTTSSQSRGSLQQGLRGASSYEEGAAMLAPAPPTPGQSPGPAAAPGGQTQDPSVAGQMPSNVDLRSARVSFTLPANKKLAGSALYDATTRYATTITLSASASELSVSASPSLPFDVQWPGQNMNFSSAGVNFGNGQPFANFWLEGGLGSGFIDVSDKGEDTVKQMLRQAIAGTAMARPGYNPMNDRDLTATLNRIKANFDALPTGAGAGGVSANEVSSPRIGASLAMKSPFFQAADGAGLRIPAGGLLDVDIQGSGNLSRLLAAGNPQAAAMAANIQYVQVTSDAIELVKDNKPLAKLQSLRITRGGQVTVERFEMLGGLGTGAGVESLLRLLVGVVAYASQGVPPELGAHATVASGNAEPEIVRGVSKQMIEQGLTQAVQKLLRDNRGAIPGVDLSLVFGVQ